MFGLVSKNSAIVQISSLVLITLVVTCMAPVRGAGAFGAPVHSTSATASPAEEEHGLSQKAEEIGRVRNFPVTNSMVVSWLVALTLIVFVQLATRNMKPVPSGAQNLLEWLVESLYKFIEEIIGPL
jgi:F-type H+-transporting ATPase subunit a